MNNAVVWAVSQELVTSILRVEEITQAKKSVRRLLTDGGDTFLRNVGSS
jgi:hypothetical protein